MRRRVASVPYLNYSEEFGRTNLIYIILIILIYDQLQWELAYGKWDFCSTRVPIRLQL